MRPEPKCVETALRQLFPTGVAVAAERIGAHGTATLWQEELSAIHGAVLKRQEEFAAGRTAARRTLAALGHPMVALPAGRDRAAIWPKGISGSIAHGAGLAIAASRRGGPIGIDLEPDAALEADLWPVICSTDELQRLAGDTGRLVRQIFCAKEAVFKAQLQDHRSMFGFDAVQVTLAEGSFSAQFRSNAGVFCSGQILTGRLRILDGLILAGVAW